MSERGAGGGATTLPVRVEQNSKSNSRAVRANRVARTRASGTVDISGAFGRIDGALDGGLARGVVDAPVIAEQVRRVGTREDAWREGEGVSQTRGVTPRCTVLSYSYTPSSLSLTLSLLHTRTHTHTHTHTHAYVPVYLMPGFGFIAVSPPFFKCRTAAPLSRRAYLGEREGGKG